MTTVSVELNANCQHFITVFSETCAVVKKWCPIVSLTCCFLREVVSPLDCHLDHPTVSRVSSVPEVDASSPGHAAGYTWMNKTDRLPCYRFRLPLHPLFLAAKIIKFDPCHHKQVRSSKIRMESIGVSMCDSSLIDRFLRDHFECLGLFRHDGRRSINTTNM